MKVLVKKGFVFTCERHRDFDKIKRRYPEWDEWIYIYVGHNTYTKYGCKMIMNTASYKDDDYWGETKNVDFRRFYKEILPTW